MKLYWVITAGHHEDLFMLAPDEDAAVSKLGIYYDRWFLLNFG